jgi:DNA-binding NarL/FixJ family response regulator
MKILVVDDDSSLRDIAKTYLESHGHEVTTADNGVEALSLYRHGEFDFVFSDYQMPRKNGVVLLMAARKTTSRKPRISSGVRTAGACCGGIHARRKSACSESASVFRRTRRPRTCFSYQRSTVYNCAWHSRCTSTSDGRQPPRVRPSGRLERESDVEAAHG